MYESYSISPWSQHLILSVFFKIHPRLVCSVILLWTSAIFEPLSFLATMPLFSPILWLEAKLKLFFLLYLHAAEVSCYNLPQIAPGFATSSFPPHTMLPGSASSLHTSLPAALLAGCSSLFKLSFL